ncbi:hypothetical protein E3O62_06365 [Cryobacterium sp. TMT2-15-1]|uniref:hypothetical protein n=1 Tax=Cryobacterium sp. TMT2-15-1 TaxID=1259246 RepID=UPI00106D0AB8|nr:hypothetical protein [Cryobacterium sp. TMT2-15-1]TFC60333.1 hypothetical protein E3O62_06365 [Cryobacterium sp. TMT2-15-1]
MQTPRDSEMVGLVDRWGAHFGWFDGKIDLGIHDFSAFATSDCTVTAHAPLWGTKEGAERAIPIQDVRQQLARLLKWARVTRRDMQLAIHPDGDALGIFVRVEGRLPLLPITVRTMRLAFVVTAAKTADGLRISKVDEWSAADPEAARRILVDHHDWPADTALHPQVAFGAVS